jgi:hypothetical protein
VFDRDGEYEGNLYGIGRGEVAAIQKARRRNGVGYCGVWDVATLDEHSYASGGAKWTIWQDGRDSTIDRKKLESSC